MIDISMMFSRHTKNSSNCVQAHTRTTQRYYTYYHKCIYSTKERTCSHTHTHKADNQIQVDAGVFLLLPTGCLVGWKGENTHLTCAELKTRAKKGWPLTVCWSRPRHEPQAPGHAGSLTRGQRSVRWAAKGLKRGDGVSIALLCAPHLFSNLKSIINHSFFS